MKNYLAIDTSNEYLTVVAVKDGVRTVTALSDCAMRHSVMLAGAVDETLERAGLTLSECDFFAACVGAGSFTGIRIGVAAIKGFALAAKKPTLPVTSFELAAYNAVEGEKPLVLVDALHGYYYACGFDGRKKMTYAPAYLSAEEVLTVAKEGGYTLYALTELPLDGVRTVSPAEGLARAVETLSKDEKNFGALTALYIRKSQAEENLGK